MRAAKVSSKLKAWLQVCALITSRGPFLSPSKPSSTDDAFDPGCYPFLPSPPLCPPQASVYDLYDMTSLTADELGDEPGYRRKTGSVSDEMLDTERLAWCTRILNQVEGWGGYSSRYPRDGVCGQMLNQVEG